MLSDEGSVVIRKFGILNTNVPPDVKRFYGIPFPGQYLIAPDGTVKDKLFLEDYRERSTASEIVLRDFGVSGNSATIKAEDITVTVALSGSTAVGGRRLGVTAEFEIAAGWHIYGEPLPSGYTATSIIFGDDLVAVQTLKFPQPHMVDFKNLGETLPVYNGKLKAAGYIVLRQTLKPGEYRLSGTIHFQECSESVCQIPRAIKFELPLRIDSQTGPAKV